MEETMNLSVSKFGEVLMSRPAGKEAFAMANAYIFSVLKPEEKIELDFEGVKVLTPSWADEFITGIKNSFSNEIKFLNTDNESVEASLKVVLNFYCRRITAWRSVQYHIIVFHTLAHRITYLWHSILKIQILMYIS